jgi:hypothetical protein
MTIFSTPRLQRADMGAHEFGAGAGESLGATAAEAVEEMPSQQLFGIRELQAASGDREDLTDPIARLQAGEDLNEVVSGPKLLPPQVGIIEARARVKDAGLDKVLNLPEMPTMSEPSLDIMIERARHRQERAATIARGPQGVVPTALGVGTSFVVGALDPVNLAAAFIPVVGELRYAKMLESAGESAIARAGVRAGVGAASGAVGMAAIEPIAAYAKTQEGQDYTMVHALRSVIFGAALGGILHPAGGAISDVLRTRGERPLYPFDVGEPMEFHTPFDELRQPPPGSNLPILGDQMRTMVRLPETFEEAAARSDRYARGEPEPSARPDSGAAAARAADTGERAAAGAQAAAAGEGVARSGLPDETAAQPGLSRGETTVTINGETRTLKTEWSPEEIAAAQRAPSPLVATIDDLPPRAREDLMRGSTAALIDGRPVQAGEMLAAGAARDPRIAESIREGNAQAVAHAAEFTPHGRAVFDDMRGQLQRAGMTPEEAAANAAIVAARYEARAARLDGAGGTAEDLYRAEGIRVQGPGQEAVDEFGRLYGQRRPQRGLPGQEDLFGGARASDADMAQRGANEPLRPIVAQKPMDEGLFGDTAAQTDLIDQSRKPQRELFQPPTAPTFFSAVSRAIDSARQEKASPDQWLATLRNTPGVKPEEIQWLGIADWLKEQKGPVSRKDVQEFIRANNIEVREVQKGASDTAALEAQWEAAADAVNAGNAARLPERHLRELRATRDAIREEIRLSKEDVGQTKFSQYTLPGGENYRELLLRLPEQKNFGVKIAEGAYRLYDYKSGDWVRTADGKVSTGYLSAEEAQTAADGLNATAGRNPMNNYQSSHFEEPNIISHIRFNDRLIDGKKALFVEEVQSDWHQAGKRRGYSGGDEKAKYRAERGPDGAVTVHDDLGNAVAAFDRNVTDREAIDRSYAAARPVDNRVPDAPFKTTWPELAMKRMIRYAAENGYDKVAWTPGEVQAERYDLSKQISRINYQRTGNDRYEVEAFDHGGNSVLREADVPAARVEDLVGKDIAKKMIDNVGTKANEGPYRLWHSLEGLDLKVGGEGMKGFYDKILPATVNKLVKKFGAKVGEAKLGVEEPAGRDMEIRERGGNFDVVEAENGILVERFPNRDMAEAYMVSQQPPAARAQSVHTLDITPQLRKAATEEGFPLFQRSSEDQMRGRITLADNKAIIDLFRSSDRSTFMHETGHLWLDELARDAARENAPEAIRNDMETVLKWLGAERSDTITTEQHEKWARAFEQYLASGNAPSEGLRAVFEQFKEWLAAIYKGIVGANEPIAPEIKAVMDRMLSTPEQEAERARPSNVIPGPGSRKGPAARDPLTFSLLEFIASRGGIRADESMVSDLRSSIGRDNKFVPGFGQLIRKPRQLSTAERAGGRAAPMTLDQAREAAVEAGYLHDAGDVTGGEAQTTIRTLLDAIDGELRGNRLYREGHAPKQSERARADELEEHRAFIEREAYGALRDEGSTAPRFRKRPWRAWLKSCIEKASATPWLPTSGPSWRRAIMARKPGQQSESQTTSRVGTRFLMTPAQHQRQADLLRTSEDPQKQALAAQHEALSLAIARRLGQATPPGAPSPTPPGTSTNPMPSPPAS